MLKMNWGSVCIKGNFRDNNEDRMEIDPEVRYFIVCDGMGGQNAGEKASGLATKLVPEKLQELLDFEETDEEKVVTAIDEAVRYANMEIMSMSELDPDCRNMGTTIVLLVVVQEKLYIGGIGDSRVYLYRDDKLEQLTLDHTITQALVRAGTITEEEAVGHRYSNVLHRYLGSAEGNKGTEAKACTPQSGDRFLLCSDWVNDDGKGSGATDEQLSELLGAGESPQTTAENIVAAAEAGGSKDNITCIVIDIE